MKRTFVDNPKEGHAAVKLTKADLTFSKEELAANRLQRLLETNHEVAELTEEIEKLHTLKKLMDLRAKVQKEHPHSSYAAAILDDGTPVYQVLIEAPPSIIALMDARPFLSTQLMWAGARHEQRIEILAKNGLAPELADAENIMDVLPQASLDFLLGWQKEINSGGAWAVSLTVGEAAEGLIEFGYTILGPESVVVDPENDRKAVASRTEVTPGRPGSVGYGQAMMGERYMTWLLANE